VDQARARDGGSDRRADRIVPARRSRIAHEPRPDHAAYIASWLQLLKDEPRAIFTAASKAQAAADWMHARQP
jgi:antirestriction protein ArdC